jgi:hypothetical protein
VNAGSSFIVKGAGFRPGRTVTVRYYDPSASASPKIWRGTVACNGSFSHQFTPVTSLILSRGDKVTATDGIRSAFYRFTLKALR